MMWVFYIFLFIVDRIMFFFREVCLDFIVIVLDECLWMIIFGNEREWEGEERKKIIIIKFKSLVLFFGVRVLLEVKYNKSNRYYLLCFFILKIKFLLFDFYNL